MDGRHAAPLDDDLGAPGERMDAATGINTVIPHPASRLSSARPLDGQVPEAM
ncbi:MAG: hypothetical protein H0X18_19000 [Geodermatophilaceae bacterium]|nr:hypothetical protein [Geodermatophilaceae bacterium]